MYHAKKVKINISLVEHHMAMRNLSKAAFSQEMGHCASWWQGVKKNGYVMPQQAKLICSVLGMDYNKLVIPDNTETHQDEKKPLYADDESIQALVNSLDRIEKKMEAQAICLNRLEIQMRTILKELGVK